MVRCYFLILTSRYINWWNKESFEPQSEAKIDVTRLLVRGSSGCRYDEGYFTEYYRPHLLTFFDKLFAFNMISSLKYGLLSVLCMCQKGRIRFLTHWV